MLRRINDTVLWRNRARYMLKHLQEALVLGSGLRDTASFSFNDHVLTRWIPHAHIIAERHQRFMECPAQAGLWVCASALGTGQLESVRQFAAAACGPLPWEVASCDKTGARASALDRTPSYWPWHEYDPARWMAPVLVGLPAEDLFGFEVFDNVPPDRWLRLERFGRHENAAAGAQVLNDLPRWLRSRLQKDCCLAQSALLEQMSVCSFLQLQVRTDLLDLGIAICPSHR